MLLKKYIRSLKQHFIYVIHTLFVPLSAVESTFVGFSQINLENHSLIRTFALGFRTNSNI